MHASPQPQCPSTASVGAAYPISALPLLPMITPRLSLLHQGRAASVPLDTSLCRHGASRAGAPGRHGAPTHASWDATVLLLCASAARSAVYCDWILTTSAWCPSLQLADRLVQPSQPGQACGPAHTTWFAPCWMISEPRSQVRSGEPPVSWFLHFPSPLGRPAQW